MATKAVLQYMRGRVLGFALGLVAVAPFVDAQQLQFPDYGCRAAPSCMPAGFSILNRERGIGPQVGPALGLRWGPGFEVIIPGRENFSVLPRLAPEAGSQIFHLGSSLVPPPLTPAPLTSVPLPPVVLPAPTPTPDPPKQN